MTKVQVNAFSELKHNKQNKSLLEKSLTNQSKIKKATSNSWQWKHHNS